MIIGRYWHIMSNKKDFKEKSINFQKNINKMVNENPPSASKEPVNVKVKKRREPEEGTISLRSTNKI